MGTFLGPSPFSLILWSKRRPVSPHPSIFVLVSLYNRGPQTQQLIKQFYCLRVSVGQKSRLYRVGPSTRGLGSCDQVSAALQFSPEPRVHLQPHSGCWQTLVPYGCRTEVPSILLLVDWGQFQLLKVTGNPMSCGLGRQFRIWILYSFRLARVCLYDFLHLQRADSF